MWTRALILLVFSVFTVTSLAALGRAQGYDIYVVIRYEGASTVQQGGIVYWTANYSAPGVVEIRITGVNLTFADGSVIPFTITQLPLLLMPGAFQILNLHANIAPDAPVGSYPIVFKTGWDAYLSGQWVVQSPLVDDKVGPLQIIAPIASATPPTVNIDYTAGTSIQRGKLLNFTAAYQAATANTFEIRILYTNATVDSSPNSFPGSVWPLVLQPGDRKALTLQLSISSDYPLGSHAITFTTKWQKNQNSQWQDQDPVSTAGLSPFQVTTASSPSSTSTQPGGPGQTKGNGSGGIDPIYFVAIGVAVAALVTAAILVTRRQGSTVAAQVTPRAETAPTATLASSLGGICPNCREETHAGATFCPNCGTKLIQNPQS